MIKESGSLPPRMSGVVHICMHVNAGEEPELLEPRFGEGAAHHSQCRCI